MSGIFSFRPVLGKAVSGEEQVELDQRSQNQSSAHPMEFLPARQEVGADNREIWVAILKNEDGINGKNTVPQSVGCDLRRLSQKCDDFGDFVGCWLPFTLFSSFLPNGLMPKRSLATICGLVGLLDRQ